MVKAMRPLFVLLTMISADLAVAQEGAVQDTTRKEIEPLDLQDVARATESVVLMVERASGRLASSSDLERTAAFLDSTYANFEKLVAGYEQFRQGSPNRQKLDSEINILERAAATRDNLQASIRDFLNRMNNSRVALNEEKAIWELTYASAVASDAPESLLNAIQNSIDMMAGAIDETSSQINMALDLSARLADQKNQISVMIDDLERWGSSGSLGVFHQRHPAIWVTNFAPDPEAGPPPSLHSVKDKWVATRSFARNFRLQLYVFGVCAVLLTILILYIKRRSRVAPLGFLGESAARIHDIVQKYTVPTVVYLTALGAYFYLVNLPNFWTQVLMVVILTTTYLLTRPFAERPYRHVILFILAAYLLDEAKTYIWFSSVNYRLYMYFEALAALGVLAYFIRNVQWKQLKASIINTIIRYGVWVLAVLNVISAIANTLGYTNLSDLMLRVSVGSAAMSTVVIGIISVLGGIVGTSVTIYFSERETFDADTIARLRKQTLRIVNWLAALIWVSFILSSADLYKPILDAMDLWLTEPWVLGEFSIAPQNILTFFMVIAVTILITRSIAVAIDGGALGFLKVKQGVLEIVSMVLRYIIVAFAIAVALGALGIDLSNFGLLAGALGVGIGFGLQNIVGNFIAGMILIFERPIEKGDMIEVAGLMGIVLTIGVRSSKIKSFDGADIVIPNGTLLSNNLVNWTHADKFKRIEILVGTAYGTDPDQVKRILLDAAESYPKTQKKPPPMALFQQFGGSSIDFRLLFWVNVDDLLTARSDVSMLVYSKLAEAGVEIPFPRQDITILGSSE